jgi:putative endonuclease
MYVYILECSDNSYYVGVTNDVEARVEEHNSGLDKASYTHSRRPVKLVYEKLFFNPLDAIEYEKKLKGWSRAKKQALIENNIEKLKELSECGNKTSHKHYKKN